MHMSTMKSSITRQWCRFISLQWNCGWQTLSVADDVLKLTSNAYDIVIAKMQASYSQVCFDFSGTSTCYHSYGRSCSDRVLRLVRSKPLTFDQKYHKVSHANLVFFKWRTANFLLFFCDYCCFASFFPHRPNKCLKIWKQHVFDNDNEILLVDYLQKDKQWMYLLFKGHFTDALVATEYE